MLEDRLRKAWDARRKSTTVNVVMRFSEEGLVLGAGTVLARSGVAARDVVVDTRDPRLRTLLTAAHLSRPTARALVHLRRAAECWCAGDDAMAAMHLVLSQVDRLRNPESDARRLFLADGLLKSGAGPDEIIGALESGKVPFEQLRKKYNPDEPRVPAGNGMTSGRWTTGNGLSEQPSAEVNPETVTSVGNTKGSYQGPDACHKARVDCQINVREAGAQDDPIRAPYYANLFSQCSEAEVGCEFMDFSVDRLPISREGWVLFPDGGVVVARQGQDITYYPREIAAMKFPHWKSRY